MRRKAGLDTRVTSASEAQVCGRTGAIEMGVAPRWLALARCRGAG